MDILKSLIKCMYTRLYVIEAGGVVGAIPYKVAIRFFIWHNTPEAIGL